MYFKQASASKAWAVRDVKAEQIGKLVAVKGIVTRTTEVKPTIEVATYTCDKCGSETYQPVIKNTPTPLLLSPLPASSIQYPLVTRSSQFKNKLK